MSYSIKHKLLWNKQLTTLADNFCSRGFGGEKEEALACIIAPLSIAKVLPFPHAVFESVYSEVAEACKAGHERYAASIYREFWNEVKCYAQGNNGVYESAVLSLVEALNNTRSQVLALKNYAFDRRWILEDMAEFFNGQLNDHVSNSAQGLEILKHVKTLFEKQKRQLHLNLSESIDDDDDIPIDGQIPDSFKITESHLEAINTSDIHFHPDQTKRDVLGRVPLHYAAIAGREWSELDKDYLVRFNVQAKDHNGYTPLHYACAYNRPVERLLELNVKLEIQAYDGMYPMHLAARQGNTEAIGEMLEWSAAPSRKKIDSIWRLRDYNDLMPIHWAVINGHSKVIEQLKEYVVEEEANGRVSLHLAVYYCNSETFGTVCRLSHDKNKIDMDGNTALRLACANKKWEIAHQLIQAGVDANIRKESQDSILQIALAEEADANLIEAFIQGGARLAVPSTEIAHLGSPLHTAAARGDPDIVKILLAGTDGAALSAAVNSLDHSGLAPLHHAVASGSQDVVEALLAIGADLDCLNGDGETPIHFFLKRCYNISLSHYFITSEESLEIEAMIQAMLQKDALGWVGGPRGQALIEVAKEKGYDMVWDYFCVLQESDSK